MPVFNLGSWVVGLLAESGRKKLITLAFGSEQERALHSAATEAIQLTAREIHPADDEQASQLEMVIDQCLQ